MKRYSLVTGKGAPKNRKYCITRALFLHALNEHCAPKFTRTVIHFSEEPSITVSLFMLGLVLEKKRIGVAKLATRKSHQNRL